MNGQLISMLLAFNLTFALGMLVYCALFSYSFKRRGHFILRAVCSALGMGTVSTGIAFALYGILSGIYDSPSYIMYVDFLRAGASMLYTALGAIAITVCYEEKASLVLFALVAGSAALTISNTLYGIFVDVFRLNSIYFTMYGGYDAWSFVTFYLVHIFVIVAVWLLFARPFARVHKDFGKSVNKFVLGLYVIYAFFTAGISGSQYFNMALMGLDSFVIPLIFNGFSVFFAAFVLFVQRFNLIWAKDLQEQEAVENFHQHYKDRANKQQENVQLINSKLNVLKEQLATVLADHDLDEAVLDELQKAIAVFDSSVQTGCEALDVLLTQKSLPLEAKHIVTSVMVEGNALSFMDTSDVNSFFGIAIDNAVEYLETVDEEKRFLRISTTRNRSLLAVRIENFCDKELTFGPDGRPHSTKKGDSGGYGTQSIRSVTQKYGGTATFSREGDLFVIHALFSACEPF